EAAKKLVADGISLQFPPQITAGTERPYFLMGDASDAVYLLRWENAKGVTEATANGPTKLAPIQGGEATAKAVYANGQYRLVIKRPLVSKDTSRPTFVPAVFMPVAFQGWDGGAGEGGTKTALTSWYYLRLEEPQSNRRFVIPPVVAILTLAVMLLVVRVANRRGELELRRSMSNAQTNRSVSGGRARRGRRRRRPRSGPGRSAGRRDHRGRGDVRRRAGGREAQGEQGHREVRDRGDHREGRGRRQQGARQRGRVRPGCQGRRQGGEGGGRSARLQVRPARDRDDAGRARPQEL